MDYKTKRRLLVAIIIIALAVIFLPIPFSKHKQPVASDFKQIPSPPTVNKPDALQHETPDDINQRFQAKGPVVAESPLPSNTDTQQTVSSQSASAVAAAANSQGSSTQNDAQTAEAQSATPASAQAQSTQAQKQAVKLPAMEPGPAVFSKDQEQQIEADQKAAQAMLGKSKQAPASLAPINNESSASKTKAVAKSSVTHQLAMHKHLIKKPVTASNNEDDSDVVENFEAVGQKPVTIRRDALGHFPKIDVRQDNASSSNVVDYQARRKIAQAHDSAYVIQLGSFVDEAPARKVIENLRSQGYAAFIQSATVRGKSHYRIYVGPFTREQKAEALMHMIDKKMKMHGYVHPFKPTMMMN